MAMREAAGVGKAYATAQLTADIKPGDASSGTYLESLATAIAEKAKGVGRTARAARYICAWNSRCQGIRWPASEPKP